MFPTDDEVEDLLKFMDGDGSGVIEFDELLKHMADQVKAKIVITLPH